MTSQQILFVVEHEIELLEESMEHQIIYLTGLQHFLEYEMKTISVFDGMDLNEHLRYYELKDAIQEIKHRIAQLRVRKPIARFVKLDDAGMELEK